MEYFLCLKSNNQWNEKSYLLMVFLYILNSNFHVMSEDFNYKN